MEQYRIQELRQKAELTPDDLMTLLDDAETINALVWASHNLRSDGLCQMVRNERQIYRCPAYDACQGRPANSQLFCTSPINSRQKWLGLYREGRKQP